VSPPASGRRVLVVDDHAELRRLTVQFLELLGYTAREASDSTEARQIAATGEPIDVVLLDLQLGAASGVDLANDLERARPDLRVLFMSGHGREDYLLEDPQRPHRHFIEKPFTLARLEAALLALSATGAPPGPGPGP
jgi:DNA-binding NtrC family response regulator